MTRTEIEASRVRLIHRRALQPSGRAIAATLLVAGVLAGCGGTDTSGDVTEDTTDVAAPTTAPAAATTAVPTEPAETPTTAPPAQEEPAATVDVSTATVTVGDETYDFGATGFITERCNPSFFGGAQVILQLLDVTEEPLTVGGQMVFLDIALIPNDPSSTAVNVPTPEPDREWIADSESVQVSGTSVDDWSIDGNIIRGSATFASTAGEGPVPGTFEILCAEE
jgi:hypothetical protein